MVIMSAPGEDRQHRSSHWNDHSPHQKTSRCMDSYELPSSSVDASPGPSSMGFPLPVPTDFSLYSTSDNSQPYVFPSPKRRGRRPKKGPHQIRGPYRRSPAGEYRSPGRPRKQKTVEQPKLEEPPDVSSILGLREAGSLNLQENCAYNMDNVFLTITEQPQPKALRFRYKCEGRSAGSIPGMNSVPENKTYPTIKLENYSGSVALVVVSCVSVDRPYRPHPHNLVGKDGCEGGVCSVRLRDNLGHSFANLGIQCVKKRDVDQSLSKRENKGIDPFCTGFLHRNQPQNIDLNAVRLCFQVYLEDKRGELTIPINPIISETIYDKKATSDLVISKLSDCSSPAEGGREIILLCDKVTKEDVQICFSESSSDWEAIAEFPSANVHKQVAISFTTPQYKDINITEMIEARIQLRRPSDNNYSLPRPFFYFPSDSGQTYKIRKLSRSNSNSSEKEMLGFLDSCDSMSSNLNLPQQQAMGPLPQTSSDYLPIPVATTVYQSTLYDNSNEAIHAPIYSVATPDKQILEFQSTDVLQPTDKLSTTFLKVDQQLLDLDSQSLVESTATLPNLGFLSPKDLSSNDKCSLDRPSTSSSAVTEALSSSLNQHDVIRFSSSQESSSSPLQEGNCSPNSAEVKKLKLDLEALNRLTR